MEHSACSRRLHVALIVAAAVLSTCSLTAAQTAPQAPGPSNTAAIGATRLLDLQTCTAALPPGANPPAGSNQLPPGTFGCRAQGLIRSGDVRLLTFNLPAPTLAEPYTLMIMMRSVNGFPVLTLSTPQSIQAAANSTGSPGSTWVLARPIFKMEASGEWFIALPPEFLASHPGSYTLRLEGGEGDPTSMYTITVSTPSATTLVAPEDLSFLQDLYNTCCRDTQARGGFCNAALPAALAHNRTLDDDLCHLAPFSCDAQGHLTQLTLAGTGLDCGDAGLPDSLVKLQSVQLVDLAFTNIGGSFEKLAQLTGQLPALERMFIRYAGVSGPLACGLVNSSALHTLSISGNPASGSVPDCFLSDPTLEELYMSHTNLTGPLPDTFGADSNLRVLYAINRPPGSGLTGSIPPSIANAGWLQFLDLSANSLTGDIPQLPDSLTLLTLSANNLDGTITNIPAAVEILDLDGNNLRGQFPNSLVNASDLAVLTAAGNQLTGELAGILNQIVVGELSLEQIDLSSNALTGDIPQLPDSVIYLNVSSNPLGGSIQGVSPGLVVLDASSCGLTGSLPSLTGGSLSELYALNNSLSGAIPALPSELQVLYLGDNQLSSSLPAIPGSLFFLDAPSNQLSGPLPELPGGSLLRAINLPNNQFTGDIPLSWLRNAGNLTLLDLHNNSLTGGLNPPEAAAPAPAAGNAGSGRRRSLLMSPRHPLSQHVGGVMGDTPSGGARKLRQAGAAQQDSPNPAQDQAQRAAGATGSTADSTSSQGTDDVSDEAVSSGNGTLRKPWHLPRLAYLDLSHNNLGGSIPATLGQLRNLLHLDLSSAGLSGGLEEYAATLSNNADRKLLVQFNASFNQLSGRVPQALAAAPILDGRSSSAVARLANTPRWLELSHNNFSGPFPTWLPPRAVAASIGCQCQLWVDVNGPDTSLTCPSTLTGLSEAQVAILARFGMECVRPSDGRKILLTTLSDGSGGPLAAQQDAAGPAGSSGGRQAALSGGAIAGIVIGSLAGAALLAMATVLGVKKYRRHKDGWRKEEIPHGPGHVVESALGGTMPVPGGIGQDVHAGHDQTRLSGDLPFSTIELGPAGFSKSP